MAKCIVISRARITNKRACCSLRYHDKSVNIRTKREHMVTYSQNRQTRNLSGLQAVHLLEPPIQALCSNPGHQPKGHHVPHWMVCLSGFKPRAGWCTNVLFLPLLLADLERQITRQQSWEYIDVALSSTATAIPLRWWQLMARLKAHDPRL